MGMSLIGEEAPQVPAALLGSQGHQQSVQRQVAMECLSLMRMPSWPTWTSSVAASDSCWKLSTPWHSTTSQFLNMMALYATMVYVDELKIVYL